MADRTDDQAQQAPPLPGRGIAGGASAEGELRIGIPVTLVITALVPAVPIE
jgi:hypothetical protein